MAITFNLEIKESPTSQGKFPIFIRITQNRKHKRLKTSVELSRVADWNPKGSKNHNWVRSSEKNARLWNEALERELEEAKALYREDRQTTIESLVSKYKSQGASSSFLDYAKAEVAEQQELGKTTAKHYATFCKKFEAFLASKGRKEITFVELSPALIASFESYLQKESNEKLKDEAKRLHPNYIRTLLVKFRALVNKAIKEGLMPADKYPFKSYTIPKEIEANKEALDASEIDAITALEYPEGSMLWHTKNAFLLSLYCAGIRAGDLLQLRWRNIKDGGTRLEYMMGKNHKQKNIPLIPQAQAILSLYQSEGSKPSDFIFPLLSCCARYAKYSNVDTMPIDLKKELFSQIYSKNAILNKNLKRVAFDAKIGKHLSFHISRHSFASLAREKAVPSKVVQEALAHSSLTTTERYLHSFSTEEVDTALQQVFGNAGSKQDALLQALQGLGKQELKELLAKLDK